MVNVRSADGVSITYQVQGQGQPALVFVHGWSCDHSYWDTQVRHFAPHYTVVTLDLAGHGTSGRKRRQWTMAAFGQDVVAVVEQLGLEQVVLIGHSMGGPVIFEAAQKLPQPVIGLVVVDAYFLYAQPRTPQQIDAILTRFRADFVAATRDLVREMFLPASDPNLVEQIVNAMSAAHPEVGIGSAEQSLSYQLKLGPRLQAVQRPIIAINADYRPNLIEAAQRYGIELVSMSGVGHFVMLEDPNTFNRLLDEAVKTFVI